MLSFYSFKANRNISFIEGGMGLNPSVDVYLR
jgi:hypothetical protein